MKLARLVTIVLLVATSAAYAATERRSAGRFDDRVLYRAGGAVAIEARTLASLDPADPLRHDWEAFGARHGGGWKILVDPGTGMPSRASGKGVPLFGEERNDTIELAEVESLARTFLDQNKAVMGEWGSMLELDLEASGRLARDHWQLIFRQAVNGVRVENARLDMHVKRGRMVMLGAAHWGEVNTSAVPTLSVADARTVLDRHVGVATATFETVGEPELSLIAGPGDDGMIHALIWRFRFREPGAVPLWVGEVDAHEGVVRAFFDDARYASIKGGVFPTTNEGDCDNGGCETGGFPMPFADFTETGQVEEFADPFGNMVCVVPTETFETNLSGPYVAIVDECGTVSEFSVCDDGLDLGFKYGENCDVDPGGSSGNSSAARTAYYHVNRVAQAARFYNPVSSWLEDPLTVEVNQPGSCNAFWNGTSIRMLQKGSNCGNTGELSGVLVHEWGHGYDFNDGGGEDVPSEAYSDVVAMFYNRASCVSAGWYNDGTTCTGYGDTCLTCTGIRDHDWAARINNTPATPENFSTFCPSGPGGPCGREPHCEAYPIGEAIFDLATRDLPAAGLDPDSAWQLAERLWYSTRAGSGGNVFDCFRPWLAHSCFAFSWMQRMLVADDDDGDLSNGTPHAAAIFASFDRHEISCGSASDPENQSSSSCPTLTAPVLSAVETPSGTELSWAAVAGAGEIRVYRNEVGCNRQQVPIASLPGGDTIHVDATADPELHRYYRVEALGVSPACHGPVSNCVTTPLNAGVQPLSFDIVESGAVVNGFPDPGEIVRLPVAAFNAGHDVSTGTQGSLQFTDPAQGEVLDGQVTWSDIAPGGTAGSDAPHFEVRVYDTVNCGDSVTWDVDSWAANSATTRRRFGVTLGNQDRDFTNDTEEMIPDVTTVPVTSTLVIAEDETISEIDVSISVSQNEPTELIVELTSPEGTTVRLHDQTAGTSGFGLSTRYDLDRTPDGPGTMQDFDGESTVGTWTLSVEDVGTESTSGFLSNWTLHFTAAGAFDCEEPACAEPPPTDPPAGLTLGKTPNGGAVDLDFSWSPVAVASGYNVLQSTDETFGSGVLLSGTTGGTTLSLPDGVNTTPALTFFQVRAVNGCGQEGP